MNQNDVVVGIGEALWDILPDGKKIGGAPANFAYHVSQFGLSSCVVSAVGADKFGKEIMENLSEKGVNQLITEVDYPTGTVQVELDDSGVPEYEIKENVAWDNIPFTDELAALASRTKAVSFGSLAQRSDVSRLTIERFLEAIPKTDDTLIVFDANLRQEFYSKEILHASLQRCNVLKINGEELAIVSRIFGCEKQDVQESCKSILSKFGLKVLILTCGVDGSYVFTADKELFQATPKVDVADTVGAGDSFTAAFVASLLRGKAVEDAHKIAVDTSAFVCTCLGAMPELPDTIKN